MLLRQCDHPLAGKGMTPISRHDSSQHMRATDELRDGVMPSSPGGYNRGVEEAKGEIEGSFRFTVKGKRTPLQPTSSQHIHLPEGNRRGEIIVQ